MHEEPLRACYRGFWLSIFIEYYSFHYDISLMQSQISISLMDLFVSTTFFRISKSMRHFATFTFLYLLFIILDVTLVQSSDA